MKNQFDKIRPYTGEETMAAVKKLFTHPNFLQRLKIFEDKIDVNEWVKEVLACKTQFEFHLVFADRVFHYFADKTCT
jgi:hypothetical protein